MAAAEVGCPFIYYLFVFAIIHSTCAQAGGKYKIPSVTIQALKPKGIRVSIPDAPNMSLFAFQGNINKPIGSSDVGTISGEVLKATDGKWIFEDMNVELKVGDVINYYVFVSVNRAGYINDNLSFTVTALDDPSLQPQPAECKPTLTTVRGGTACSGEVIFEDNFNTLREDLWQIEQYIPIDNCDYPFVSYQHLTTDPTVLVENGNLRIIPKLQQSLPGYNNESIYSGSLNLRSGCTASAEACSTTASGANILPPIASGRITSKGFAFTYGTVTIRAKLPIGDWLYPEILLEPLLKKYGSLNYASGVIKIAAARGNRQLFVGPSEYGNKVLYGGVIMDLKCREALLSSKVDRELWGNDFHIYSIRWAPDRIILSVDEEEWARIEPAASGLHGRLTSQCPDVPHTLLATGSSMAPFDDHFYISLGVAAGGVSEFRDGLYTTAGRPKPWRNYARKAMLYFWQDMDSWLQTWSQPELIVDYVKVVAL